MSSNAVANNVEATQNVAAPANNEAVAQPRQSGWQLFQSIATRMLIMYFAMNAMSYFRGGGKTGVNTPSSNGAGSSSMSGSETPGNLFTKGTKFVSLTNII